MGWMMLTDPEGNAVQVNTDQVVLVSTAPGDDADSRARALLDLSNGHQQAVRETVGEVMAQLRK